MVTAVTEQGRPRLTVSVVDMDITLGNTVLQPDECLLSTESLRDDSLRDADMSLLVAWDRKCRQGTFSASVSLLEMTRRRHATQASEWIGGPHLYLE